MSKFEIPHDWTVARLGELSSAIQYGYTAKAQEEKVGPKLLRITDIQDGAVDWDQVPFCRIENSDKSKYVLSNGDLVFARTGATVGKSYLITGAIPDAVFASYLIRVRLREQVHPKYISYFFKSPQYWRQISENSAGIGQPNVNGKKLSQLLVPVAPPDQQKRIVAEIEKQFSRLDEAVANLKRVKGNLKRYKAAVLKAAVDGKLSEEWRNAHPDVEPASELLKRILAERRNRWNGKGKYKEPEAPDTINLPSLPESWTWTSLDQLLIFLRNGISIKPTAEIGLRILRISAVRPLAVNLNDVRFLRATKEEFTDYILDPGDLLFTRYNGNPVLVGVCAVVPRGYGTTVHPDKVIRGVLVSTLSLPMFVAIMANVGVSRDHLARRVRTTAGQAGISGGDLRTMPIPLGPVGEQEWIVEEVERRLSVIGELEGQVATALQRAERFRQSILHRAFEGRLVNMKYKPNSDLQQEFPIAAESPPSYGGPR